MERPKQLPQLLSELREEIPEQFRKKPPDQLPPQLLWMLPEKLREELRKELPDQHLWELPEELLEKPLNLEQMGRRALQPLLPQALAAGACYPAVC